MKLKYFHDETSNFGDLLSPLIYDGLIDGLSFKKEYLNYNLYIIGTLINEHFDDHLDNCFFGTGLRHPYRNYNTKSWDVMFLRGPLSSGFIGCKYISDAAYSLKLLYPDKFKTTNIKRYKFSIIPYFKLMPFYNWNLISSISGVNLIDPRWSVSKVIENIADSEHVICGAMHGAIVADLFRVPWLRLRMPALGAETMFESDFKWLDWMYSVNCANYYIDLWIKNHSGKKGSLISTVELIFRIKSAINKGVFQLSTEDKVNEIQDKISCEIDLFRDKYLLK